MATTPTAEIDSTATIGPTFTSVSTLVAGGLSHAQLVDTLGNGHGRCYLGGDEHLNSTPNQSGTFVATGWPSGGHWLPNPMGYDARLGQAGAKRQDSLYLWPITHAENVNFKGVVFVDGKVAVSGKLRGRLTLASPYNIIFVGNMKLQTDPAVGTCPDYLGAFAADDVVVADNMLLSPQAASSTAGDSVWRFQPPAPTQSTYLQVSSARVEHVPGPELHGRCYRRSVLRDRARWTWMSVSHRRHIQGTAALSGPCGQAATAG